MAVLSCRLISGRATGMVPAFTKGIPMSNAAKSSQKIRANKRKGKARAKQKRRRARSERTNR
jgi:hypothetical protein